MVRHRACGLGLRRALLAPLEADFPQGLDFLELAPENWLGLGPSWQRRLRALTERVPCFAHGLSLNLGGTAPLNTAFLAQLKTFFDEHQIQRYSEHLSFCADDGQLFELLPLPFTDDAVRHVARRIREVCERLERPLAIENVSCYAAPGAAMSEREFLNAVLAEADCELMLDVNNVYVNSVNLGYDAQAFIAGLPGKRIVSAHIAGHWVKAPDLLIDTHGAPVVDAVWELLSAAYEAHGVFPTVLERDANLPPLADLMLEVRHIARLQAAA
jgi:hypothetical protein